MVSALLPLSDNLDKELEISYVDVKRKQSNQRQQPVT